MFALLSLAWRFGARHGTVALQRETQRLCLEVTGRLLDPRGQPDPPRSGELLAVATSDAEKAAQVVRTAGMFAAGLAALAVSSAALLAVDVALGLGVLLGVPVLVTLPQALAPRLTRRSAAQQAATAGSTALATDLVRGLRALQGLGAQRSAAARYRGVSQQALAATLGAAATAGVSRGLTATASGLFLAGVAGFAGWLALDRRLTVGELVTVVGLAQFVADPDVAILDEATAEAGSAGARELERAAAAATQGRTTLIVAHRLTQAVLADRIVVLAGGQVVETGPHEELVRAGGPYSTLWRSWLGRPPVTPARSSRGECPPRS